jgi:hypothetical protein
VGRAESRRSTKEMNPKIHFDIDRPFMECDMYFSPKETTGTGFFTGGLD